MSMNIHANKGDKVVYTATNGSINDRSMADMRLNQAKCYTVEKTVSVGNYTAVYLQEHPGHPFNSVMFDDVEQTLEEQVNECKEQQEDVALIAVHEGRTLLKVDAKGFVTIGETVVGHEPELPGLIDSWKGKRLINSEFNPNEAFEVSNYDPADNKWTSKNNEKKIVHYVGVGTSGWHVIQLDDGTFRSYAHIRNVKKQEFVEGQEIWFKRKSDFSDWEFGRFITDSAVMTNSGSRVHHGGNYEILPFFIDGVATYPPFL